MNRRELAFRTGAAALVCVAAAWAWWRLLGAVPTATRIIPSVLIVAFAGWYGTAGGRRVRRGIGTLTALLATFACGLILGAMTLPGSGGSVEPAAFVRGVVQGLGILLTSPVPAPADAETVTAVIIFSGYLTTIACVLVWTRAPATAVIPGFLLFLGATALGQGSVESAAFSGILFAASVLLMLAMVPKSGFRGAITDGAEFAEPERDRTPGKYIYATSTLIFVAIITLLGAQLANLTAIGTSRPSFDPHISGNYRPNPTVNPVDQVQRWQTVDVSTKKTLLTVRGTALTSALWWTTSEAYDGSQWFTRRSYDNANADVPYAGSRPSFTRPVSATVTTTAELPGPWLPNVHCVSRLSPVPIRTNDQCDIIARSDQAAGLSYQFQAQTLAPRNLAVLDATRKTDSQDARVANELPAGFPAELAGFAESAVDESDPPYQQLTDLAQALSTDSFSVAPENVYTPFTYSSLSALVTNGRGTQAQYASAFALMARYLGFSTRLATGYRLASPRGGVVTNRSAIVWPEAKLNPAGWVPFAPGPESVRAGVPVPQEFKPKPTPPRPDPQPPAPPQPQPQPDVADESGVPVWMIATAVVAGAGAAWILLVALWRRRARRRLATKQPSGTFGPWTWALAVRRHCRAATPDSPGAAERGEAMSANLGRGIRRKANNDQPPLEGPRPPAGLSSLAAIAQPWLYGPTAGTTDELSTAWELADADAAAVASESLSRRLRWWLIPLRVRSGKNRRLNRTRSTRSAKS